MKQRIIAYVLIAGSMGVGLSLASDAMAQGYKRHFHIHQTSLTSFVVTCDNGADPTGKDIGGGKAEIEISCGK